MYVREWGRQVRGRVYPDRGWVHSDGRSCPPLATHGSGVKENFQTDGIPVGVSANMLVGESLTDTVLRRRDERILRTASRERRRRKERILALNAAKNNDAMGLREPVAPIADPEPNTPFLWMTLTDQQKKKAVGKYFTQRELDSRQQGRERRRKERLQRMKEAKKLRRERYGYRGGPKKSKRKETNKRPGQNRVPLLRPVTPVTIPESSPLIITEDSLSGAADGNNIENTTGNENGTRPNTTGTVQSDAVFEE